MKIFDRFKKIENSLTLEQLIQEDYKQKYFAQCKYIWENYIPQEGQSDVLQGELLREIEKLRCEAQDNGNINWNEDFVYFCDFIKKTLCSQEMLSNDEKRTIALALEHIKECGNYANQYNSGQITDDKVDMNKIAYTKDNLYDIVADAVGLLQLKKSKPITFTKNDKIKH